MPRTPVYAGHPGVEKQEDGTYRCKVSEAELEEWIKKESSASDKMSALRTLRENIAARKLYMEKPLETPITQSTIEQLPDLGDPCATPALPGLPTLTPEDFNQFLTAPSQTELQLRALKEQMDRIEKMLLLIVPKKTNVVALETDSEEETENMNEQPDSEAPETNSAPDADEFDFVIAEQPDSDLPRIDRP